LTLFFSSDEFRRIEKRGDFEGFQSLVSKRDVNAMDCHGVSLLHHTVLSRRKEWVEYLLSHGANVNIVDTSNATPLVYATLNGDREIVTILLSRNADRHIVTSSSQTAVSIAHSRNWNDLKVLLSSPPVSLSCSFPSSFSPTRTFTSSSPASPSSSSSSSSSSSLFFSSFSSVSSPSPSYLLPSDPYLLSLSSSPSIPPSSSSSSPVNFNGSPLYLSSYSNISNGASLH
jgi:hypothetical protein